MKQFYIFLLGLGLAFNISAQQAVKSDVIIKVNGDELTGKITAITDSTVKFTYAGETLEYTIKKSDILKITYASGRVEMFNKQPLPQEKKDDAKPEQKKSDADHHNRVAILPFHFITDRQNAGDEMSYKVQTECYNFLSKHAGELSLLDPRTTNAMLIKGGITSENIRGYTMGELCDIIGVEYIIDGTITQNRESQTNIKNEQYNASSGDDKSGKKDAKLSGTSTSSTTQEFQTSISLNIYTDKNATVFNEDRRSFWTGNDAYKNALQYLLKKSPLYTK